MADLGNPSLTVGSDRCRRYQIDLLSIACGYRSGSGAISRDSGFFHVNQRAKWHRLAPTASDLARLVRVDLAARGDLLHVCRAISISVLPAITDGANLARSG